MTNDNDRSQVLWRGLLSSDADQASRAADALFASGARAETLADHDAAQALIKSVQNGNRTATAVLLLGYVDGAASALNELVREHGDDPVKLKSWSRMAPLRIAATAALSRLGDVPARHRLLEGISGYDAPTRIFLLDILSFIDASEVWHALSEYMQDTTEIREDVPSGAPRRRLCDHAVDAFLDRFNFPVTFERKPGGRYDSSEIEATLRALRNSVPQ